jgi:hypothetical protein
MTLLAMLAASALSAAGAAPDGRVYRYEVREADTMLGFASLYLTSPAALQWVLKASNIPKLRKLAIGEILVVPYQAMRWTPVNGQVVSFRGRIQIGASPARVGSVVADGAVLATDADSYVALKFPDGSLATLPSSSAVRIVSLRRYVLTGEVDRLFVIERGASEWRVTPAKSPGDRFEVRTPVSLAAVRGTEFRVTFDDGSTMTSAGVVKGEVGFSTQSAGSATSLPPGFGAVSDSSGTIDKRVLLPAPTLRDGYAVQRRSALAFAAAESAGATAYLFEVARDAAFLETFARQKATGPVSNIAGLPDGDYFIRVSAFDSVGLQGLSATFPFRRQLGEVIVTPIPKSGKWRIEWTAARASPSTYRLTVSSRSDFSEPLIDLPGLTDTALVMGPLRKGQYYVRLTAIDRGGASSVIEQAFENRGG